MEGDNINIFITVWYNTVAKRKIYLCYSTQKHYPAMGSAFFSLDATASV